MARAAVGVRELKLHAPKLVDRARNGERIVITRYGKPHAQLGPVEEVAPYESSATHPRMVAWQAEQRAFEQQLPRLERRYRGRYVAVYGGRVVDCSSGPTSKPSRSMRRRSRVSVRIRSN